MTQATTQVRPPLATSPSWLLRRPLVAYFVLAYALAWLLWLPFVLSQGGGIGVIPLVTPADASGLAYLLVLVGAALLWRGNWKRLQTSMTPTTPSPEALTVGI